MDAVIYIHSKGSSLLFDGGCLFAHFCAYFLEIIKIGQTNRIICLKTLKAIRINMAKQRKSTIGIDRF